MKHGKKYLADTWNAAMKLNKRNILGLGCDDGSWTLEISKKAKSKELYGLDIVAKQLNKTKKSGIKTKCGYLNNRWPYPNIFFDLVHSNQVIEHLRDIDLFAKETRRVLEKGRVFNSFNGKSIQLGQYCIVDTRLATIQRLLAESIPFIVTL